MAQKIPKKPHQNEGGSPRSYLITMANRHARDNANTDEAKALGLFIMELPAQPKDEIDWISEHYLKIHRRWNTKCQTTQS